MSKKRIDLKLRVTPEYKEALDVYLKSIKKTNTAAFILEAVAEKVMRDGGILPAPIAPHGVRSDALPIGWLSRLYPNRYQLVAVWDGKGWDVEHLHDVSELPNLPKKIIQYETLYPRPPEEGNEPRTDDCKVEVHFYHSAGGGMDELIFAILNFLEGEKHRK